MSFIFKPNPLQGAFLFKPSEGGSFIMSVPQRQFILNSNKTGAKGDKGDKGDTGDTGVVDATYPLVYDLPTRSISITPNYYYLASNPNGFITTSALVGYATENWVLSQDYLVSADLVGYATQSWVNAQGYLTSADLTGYATEAWVDSQGYLVSSDLTPYLLTSTAAATYYPISNPAGYITNASLSGYATESWVLGKNYITSAALTPYLLTSTAASTYYPLTNPSGYITSSALSPYLLSSTAATTYQTLAGMSAYYLASNPAGYITSAALGGYATESWVTSQGYLTAPYNPFDQTLNTTSEVTFRKTTLADGGIGTIVIDPYWLGTGITHTVGENVAGMTAFDGFSHTNGTNTIAIKGGVGITFPDSTVQTTAYTGVTNPFNQDLNTTDTVQFGGLSINDGFSGNTGIFTQPNRLELTGMNGLDGGVYASGSNIAFSLTNGTTTVQMDLNGVTFPDATVQTTAWTGSYNPFDQSLNTTDTPYFETVYAGSGFSFGAIGGLTQTQLTLSSGGSLMTVSDTAITFPDSTTQSTAAVFYNQSLNTIDEVKFNSITLESPMGSTIVINPSIITFPDATTQSKAYPFYGAVATAIEGGLLNANSPSSTNAFATLGDVESSVNAYAASITPVLPTTDEKSALSNANLPSASNPFLTLTGTPVASETTQGIIELANKAEVETPTSSSLGLSPVRARDFARRFLLKRGIVQFQASLTTQVSGTGASYSQLLSYSNVIPANAGIAGFARGYSIVNTSDPTHTSANGGWINFSKEEGFSQAIYLSNASSYAGIRTMMIFGEANSPTAGVALGDPTNKRIGVSHTSGGNILLMVHNGTTLTFVDSGATPPTSGSRKYYIEVTWDGTGYAEMYVKDTLGNEFTCSTTNAPIGSPQSLTHSSYCLQVSSSTTHTATFNLSPSNPAFYFA